MGVIQITESHLLCQGTKQSARRIVLYFYNNLNNLREINENEVKPQLDFALNMSDEEYMTLSKKTYIQGTYFREYYKDEINHLNYFMNNLC